MGTKKVDIQPYMHAKAVTVSVTYHRSCLIITDGFENLEEAVRRQLKMPEAYSEDPSEWYEDEFVVIEESPKELTIQTTQMKRVKKENK